MIWEYFFIQFSPCSARVALFATDVLGDWVFMCTMHGIANLMSHRGGLPWVGGWTVSHATYPGVTKNTIKSHGRDPEPTPPPNSNPGLLGVQGRHAEVIRTWQ